ncbi:MAG: hypothetical protein IJU04_06575 [Ruminococcus sp.]|nr:hypothetical protein [Ruminococcus sp.]
MATVKVFGGSTAFFVQIAVFEKHAEKLILLALTMIAYYYIIVYCIIMDILPCFAVLQQKAA